MIKNALKLPQKLITASDSQQSSLQSAGNLQRK